MVYSIKFTVMAAVCCCMLMVGCGGKVDSQSGTGQAQVAQINCIAVLPAAFLDDNNVVPVYLPENPAERQGIQTMNEILSDQLGGKDGIRFVGLDSMASLSLTGGENQLTLAKMVGEKTSCNAVLESSVSRFVERVGGRYSVESPASVAFAMRLIGIENGAILWSTKFNESQKSVMENILEFKKANTRGFVWITAEELMREGIKAKFADSPYFAAAGK